MQQVLLKENYGCNRRRWEKFVKGIVVKITGDVLKYRENLQIKINSIEEIKTVDKAIFLPTAPVDQQSLQEEIYSYILRIKILIFNELQED